MIGTNAQSGAYETEIRQWQNDMNAKLTAEDGWLALAGLYWLNPGVNTIGADSSSDIVLPAGTVPDTLGMTRGQNVTPSANRSST